MAVPVAYYPLGTTDYQVRLTENYDGVATDLGLGTKSTTPISGKIVMSTGALIRAGLGGRIRATVKTGTKTRRSVRLFCETSKMEEAVKGVSGKMFGTNPIVSAAYPLRAVYS